MRDKKSSVLHIENTAGVPAQISPELKKLGIKSDVLETWKSYAKYPHDFENYYSGKSVTSILPMLKTIRLCMKYDLLHIHSGLSYGRIDVLVPIILGKRAIIHYHGSDLRLHISDKYRQLAEVELVATPDLVDLAPKAFYVPNCFDVDSCPLTKPPMNHELRLLHCPTNKRKFKGTNLIIEAVNIAKEKGAKIRLDILEGVTHNEILNEMTKSDIIIDQMTDIGWFGMVSLESMSCARPTIAYLKPKNIANHGMIPKIISPAELTSEALANELLYLDNHRSSISSIGIESREYVRLNHSPKHIAKYIYDIYKGCELI